MNEERVDYFLSYFEALENRVIKFQKIVPFCHNHKKIHSPILTGIINESRSLLDFLFYTYYANKEKN